MESNKKKNKNKNKNKNKKNKEVENNKETSDASPMYVCNRSLETLSLHDKGAATNRPNSDRPTSVLASGHSWFSYKAVEKREHGASNYQSPELFCYKATGSLHMVQRFELMSKLEHPNGPVNCFLHFNASGTRLASGSDDKVCLWDWASQKPLITFASGHDSDIYQVRFFFLQLISLPTDDV